MQFNGYLPKEGPDAWVMPCNIHTGNSAFLPVNTPVQDGEEMTITGVKMQFFTRYGSDDKFHTTVWLPERKMVFSMMLWSSPPQLYSLRGILAGLCPDDLRHFVTFPKYLDDAPFNLQNYGEIFTYSPAIYYQAIGWYDNNAANMKPIAPIEEARRLVPFVGGREKVLEATRSALDKKEYAWAAKLADQVYLIDNDDMDALQLKADALRQMAYVSTGVSYRAQLMF